MGKYWVSEGQEEFMILTEENDKESGNTYRTVKDGYQTREEAETITKRLNAIY